MKRPQRRIFLPYRKLQDARPKPQGHSVPPAAAPSSGKNKVASGLDGPEPVSAATDVGSTVGAPPAVMATPTSDPDKTVAVSPKTQAIINLEGSLHDFGEVLVGGWAEWALTLHNAGEGDGVISAIEGLPSEGFSLMDLPTLPCMIPPHESLVFTVRYAPWQAGESVARLSITTNNQNLPVQIIFLIGRAGVSG